MNNLAFTLHQQGMLKETEMTELMLILQSFHISYFKNHGKKLFYKTFIPNTEFIQGRLDGTGGKLCDTSESNMDEGFLASIGIVGCKYFSKYSTSFLQRASDGLPQSLYIHLYDSKLSLLENHSIWLSHIKKSVMFRSSSEEYNTTYTDLSLAH